MLDDGEPEPGAADRAAARLVDAVEALGQARDMLGRDAVALVADRQADAVALARQFDGHRRAGAAVFHRVRDDVVRKLAELRRVAEHRLRRVAQLRDNIAGAPPFAVANLRDRGANARRQVARPSLAGSAVGLYARQGQEGDD